MLRVPLLSRLDMVLEYTARERVLQFGEGLALWEAAAGAVTRREGMLSRLAALQKGLEDGTLQRLEVGPTMALCRELVEVTAQVLWPVLGWTRRIETGRGAKSGGGHCAGARGLDLCSPAGAGVASAN
eukprot:307589-Chlamydomonas_euryale.AAC.1